MFYIIARLTTILILLIRIILFNSLLGVFCVRVKSKNVSETLAASVLRCVPSVSRVHVLPCPTFMMTFMARLLHTPPSRFSRPSTVPLEVAGVQWGGKEKEDGVTGMKREEGMEG